jgi:hypothetical protein
MVSTWFYCFWKKSCEAFFSYQTPNWRLGEKVVLASKLVGRLN